MAAAVSVSSNPSSYTLFCHTCGKSDLENRVAHCAQCLLFAFCEADQGGTHKCVAAPKHAGEALDIRTALQSLETVDGKAVELTLKDGKWESKSVEPTREGTKVQRRFFSVCKQNTAATTIPVLIRGGSQGPEHSIVVLVKKFETPEGHDGWITDSTEGDSDGEAGPVVSADGTSAEAKAKTGDTGEAAAGSDAPAEGGWCVIS